MTEYYLNSNLFANRGSIFCSTVHVTALLLTRTEFATQFVIILAPSSRTLVLCQGEYVRVLLLAKVDFEMFARGCLDHFSSTSIRWFSVPGDPSPHL